ncbi:MAG: hypothetical protein Q4A65_07060 [Bacillota bacterium]|nr:hypothetical protein [Bacillota bacterium]
MNKKLLMFMAAVVCGLMLMAGCGGSSVSLSADIDDNGAYCNITADKASDGDFVSSGVIILNDGDKLAAESDLQDGGALSVKLIPGGEALEDPEAGADELAEELNDAKPALEIELSGKSSEIYDLDKGEYYLSITAQGSSTSGSASISVK